MTAPAGAPTRLYVRAFPSPWIASGSVAPALNVTATPRTVVRVAGTPSRVGAWFASRTMTVTGQTVVAWPSVTRTWNTYTSGPSASVVGHENTPVAGSMAAPAGAPNRLNASGSLSAS